MRSEGIMARIDELETPIKELKAAQDRHFERLPVLMHPNLAEAYQLLRKRINGKLVNSQAC